MKTNPILKSALALLIIASLATVIVFAVRQDEVTKTGRPTAPKDILQFTSDGHILGFAKSGVYVVNGSHALRVEFVNAHPTAPLSTTSPSETGGTKAAPPLSQVTYPNLWDGVTLTYDGPVGAVARSTYRLAPYAKTDDIRLRYNASVFVQNDGSLRVNFKTGTLNESAPQAWQERDGKRVPVQIAFATRGKDEITFTIGHYDRSQPLFIDPTLTWNTFLGGSGFDTLNALTVDGGGNSYVAGYTTAAWGSPVRAFNGGSQDAGGPQDGFVAKLDSSGNLVWNTFLGGNSDDSCFGVAVDGSGNVYASGFSHETWGSPVRAFSGDYDGFAAKLDSNGNLIWNTFIGGAGHDEAYPIAVDGNGNVYVAGTCLATWGSPVRAFVGGGHDAFAAKLDSAGNLIWNTFLGGSSEDFSYGLAVDGSGNVYVAGYSFAPWGSPVRAFSGGQAGFAAKLDLNGNILWNTFLGGSGVDYQGGLAVDGSGNVYLSGYSSATWGSPVRAFSGGANDGYAAKLDSSGNLIWNTFLGGAGNENQGGVAIDGSGNVYVAGASDATWGSPDRAFSGGVGDGYAAKLDSSGNLIWNTFLGGSGADGGNGIGVDISGNVYVGGTSDATWGSPINAYSGGGVDGFVAQLAAPTPIPTPTPTPTNMNQCKNGGWQTLFRANGTQFKNQGDCIQYVNTGK